MYTCLTMEQLSQLDRKIIYELGRDARQSYKQIAQKIGSKKEVVAYHINQLIEKKIITRFVPVVSLSKLGIFSHKIYLRLQGLENLKEKEILEVLSKDKRVAWVARGVGRWDLLLGFYARNIIEFSKIKESVLSRLSKYIQDYDVTLIEDAIVFNRDYLLDKKNGSRSEFYFAGELKEEFLDEKDLKIINLIKNNARFNVVDVGAKLGLDPRTVMARIKSLEERKILQGYTTFLDLNKFNYQLHKLCIYLKDYHKENISELLEFFKLNSQVVHLVKSLGSWEFELEIESGDLKEVYDYINEIKNKFPKVIKQIDIVTITDELKLEFFPEKL